MNNKNKIKQLPDTIRVATFGLIFIGSLFMINLYLPSYLVNNPPVCEQQGIVQEITAIKGNKVQITLQDKSIVEQPIKNYDSEKAIFNNKIEINQTVCLKYENPISYNILKIVSRNNSR